VDVYENNGPIQILLLSLSNHSSINETYITVDGLVAIMNILSDDNGAT